MKFLFFTLVLISCSLLYAQETKNKATAFIRVYNLNGEKIAKGRVSRITDTSLVVSRKEKPINIELSKIGFIKTKRSVGNNILYGAAIGAGTGAILGLASGGESEFWGKGEGAGGFGLIFGAMGAGAGAITAIFKKTKTFSIDGKPSNLKTFKEAMGE